MEAEVWSFLSEISVEELVDRNVLQRHQTMSHILRKDSVGPLIKLMEYWGIERLYHECGWFLCDDGTFANNTAGPLKSGNVSELEQPGRLIRSKNRIINPYFYRLNPSK